LGGCDYIESIKGIGFKKAYKYVKQACGDLDLIIKKMKIDGFAVPADFSMRFDRAFLTFHF